jgi:hypothetical protein
LVITHILKRPPRFGRTPRWAASIGNPERQKLAENA